MIKNMSIDTFIKMPTIHMAMPSFWQGLCSLMNGFRTSNMSVDFDQDPYEADAESIAFDWNQVNQDIQTACKQVKTE